MIHGLFPGLSDRMSKTEHVSPKSAAFKLFADDNNVSEIPGENAEAGPGASFVRFVRMEELVEKLKLLKYDSLFCKELHQKPISRLNVILMSIKIMRN